MEISVIIPVYNAGKTIRKCLESILNSNFEKEFEVIIVDDGSTDDSIEKIQDLNVQVIRQENKGCGAARNLGVRQSKSELVIFTDADVVFFPETLRKIYEHLKKDEVDYLSIRYSKKPANDKWIHKYKALADYCYYYDFIYTKKQKGGPIKGALISGGTESYKKKVFEAIGGFEAAMKGALIEQEKMILKLREKYKIVGDGRIKTMHHYPGFKKLVRDLFWRTIASMDIVCKDKYNQAYLKRNQIRVALGALSVVGLILSIILFLTFDLTLPYWLTLIIFLSYAYLHGNMFIIAFKEYGLWFTFYTLIINLFFCCLISLAGFLGIIKNLFKFKYATN